MLKIPWGGQERGDRAHGPLGNRAPAAERPHQRAPGLGPGLCGRDAFNKRHSQGVASPPSLPDPHASFMCNGLSSAADGPGGSLYLGGS